MQAAFFYFSGEYRSRTDDLLTASHKNLQNITNEKHNITVSETLIHKQY